MKLTREDGLELVMIPNGLNPPTSRTPSCFAADDEPRVELAKRHVHVLRVLYPPDIVLKLLCIFARGHEGRCRMGWASPETFDHVMKTGPRPPDGVKRPLFEIVTNDSAPDYLEIIETGIESDRAVDPVFVPLYGPGSGSGS